MEIRMSDGYRIVLVLAILAGVCMLPVAAAETTVGGDQGWYAIYCNVYGAKIYLDDKYVGTTPQAGALTVQVFTTGTPYKTIRVQKYGYSTFIDSITKVPGKGETVDLFTTLNELPSTTETAIGGDVGWYIVHGNIDGATVLFDDSNRGEISQGILYVPVYTTGTPYREYTVRKDGYTTFTGTIPNVPGKGETLDLYATLNPVATTLATPEKIGGDIGWYAVHSNIEGATVSFDNDPKGQIAQGNLTVKVYVTGTPYKTFTVYKSGYVPYTGTIDRYPGKGETIDLYATLNAQPGTTTIPAATPTPKAPLPPGMCGLALIIAGATASIVSRK
jgi:hypothetical protein